MIGEQWLALTRERQTQIGTLPLHTERARVDYVKDMMLALMVEAGEALQCVDWKPWRSDRTTDRDAFIEEIVDVLHFAGNLLVAFDVTDAELHEAYAAKSRVNKQRLLDTR
jgi:dimeric dUTPase (all-alpha-NTP-PPase superfamily)